MAEIHGEINGERASSNVHTTVREIRPGHYHAQTGQTSSEVFLTSSGALSDGNTLDGVEVTIESERARIIREHFGDRQQNGVQKTGSKGMTLKASMPGMVKSIAVSVGDKVQKNTPVIILEAMKMENSISAGYAGTVSKIHAQAGTSVEKNAILIEFA